MKQLIDGQKAIIEVMEFLIQKYSAAQHKLTEAGVITPPAPCFIDCPHATARSRNSSDSSD